MPADRLLHPRLGHSVKASGLSDLEHRVWITYQLAADDYGVMRLSVVTVQAANDALAQRPAPLIQRALEKLVAVGLVETFQHQGRTYCYQTDWQNYQRVKHPRDTMQPLPPDDRIAKCTSSTRKLFAQHPSKRPEEVPQDFGKVSEIVPQDLSENGSLARAHTRETANGERLMANGLGGVGDMPPMDQWARDLINLYPAQGRCGWNLVERPLFKALTEDSPGLTLEDAWEALQRRLERHKRSHQWRVKGMVPRLDRYLRDGTHLQELPEAPVSTLVTDKTARTLSSARAFAEGQ